MEGRAMKQGSALAGKVKAARRVETTNREGTEMKMQRWFTAMAVAVVVGGMTLVAPGCSGSNNDSVTGPDLNDGSQYSQDRKAKEKKKEFTVSKKNLGTNVYPGNCVFYVRTLMNLPSGLISMADKRRIINTQTAKAGRAGIQNIGDYGHVFYVTKVDDSGDTQSLTYKEANYPYGNWETKITVKNGKIRDIMDKYKIEGFYKN